MKLLSTKECKSIYSKLRRNALESYEKHEYEDALNIVSKAAELMYKCSYIYKDDMLEKILYKIGKNYVKQLDYEKENKSIIFYDYFGWDNRGLTYIYIKALYELGFKITYVVYNNHKADYNRTLQFVLKSGGKLYILGNGNRCKQIIRINTIIKESKASKVFMHTAPYDVSGVAVFSALNRRLDRFLINITDHAYWLGKLSFDKCIEFRRIGYELSYQCRKIRKNKLTYLPYYPAINKDIKFQGFKFDSSNKKVIYSGGALYKISGSNKYFKIIKYILDNYEDTVLVYTGDGDRTEIDKFIHRNGYEGRFYYQKERKDFEGLIQNCYFYLGTYPLGGGLMTQYAVAYGKFPLCLVDEKNELLSLFLDEKKVEDIIFLDLKSIYNEIDKIMTINGYIKAKEEKLKNAIISEKQFKLELYNIIQTGNSNIKFIDKSLNINMIIMQYLKAFGISREDLNNLLFIDNCTIIKKKFILRYLLYRLDF